MQVSLHAAGAAATQCVCRPVLSTLVYALSELLMDVEFLLAGLSGRATTLAAAIEVAVNGHAVGAVDGVIARVTSWDVILVLSVWHWHQYLRVRDLPPHSQEASRLLLHTLRTTSLVNNLFGYQVFLKTLLIHALRLSNLSDAVPVRIRRMLLSSGSALIPLPPRHPPSWAVFTFTLMIALFALVPLHALLMRYPAEGMPVDLVHFQGQPKPSWYYKLRIRERPYLDMRNVLRLRAQGVDVERYRLGRRPELRCDTRPSWM